MATQTDHRPLVLLLCTGRRELREYLLSAMAHDFRVHIFAGQDPTWETPYISGYTYISEAAGVDETLPLALRVNEDEPIDGVLTWQETHTTQVARVAAALGLPGNDEQAIGRCRDKHLTRQALDAAGVPQPRSVMVASEAEALEVADRIGYPVVIKPSDLAVSFGVIKVASPGEMHAAYAVTSSIPVPGMPEYRVRVLVEEFADGEEISVDCTIFQGRVQILCIARKTTSFPPYFIETGHSVDSADPLRSDARLQTLMQEAHEAIGLRDGVTHTEIKLTTSGPKIIEINGRLGGDQIPYLGLRATGVDVGIASTRVACGLAPEVAADRELAAAIRFFCVKEDNALIESIGFDSERFDDAVDEFVILAKAGERRPLASANPLRGRLAYATAVAPTLKECQEALDSAEAALQVVLAD